MCSGKLLKNPAAIKTTQSDRKSTRLNSSHVKISYAVFCLKKKIKHQDMGAVIVGGHTNGLTVFDLVWKIWEIESRRTYAPEVDTFVDENVARFACKHVRHV